MRVVLNTIERLDGKISKNSALVAISVSYCGDILVLARTGPFAANPGPVPEGASVIRTHPTSYSIFILDTNLDSAPLREVKIIEETVNLHHVQLLKNDRILVAGGRAGLFSEESKNGRIYSIDGKLLFSLGLGDGIEDIQSSDGSSIWVSYFDQGVLGDSPIGNSGLIRIVPGEEKYWELELPQGYGPMIDMYAFTVTKGGDVWFYYYSDFALGNVRKDGTVNCVKVPCKGALAAVANETHVMLLGSYERLDVGTIFYRGNLNSPVYSGTLEFVDQNGNVFVPTRIVGKGENIICLSDDRFFHTTLSALS